MLNTRELAASVYGAYRLARLDPNGLRFFDASPAGARRSFYAAAIVAPFYALMLAVGAPEPASDTLRFSLVEGIAYVLSWVAYPVIVEWLTRLLGCRERFESYLAAYNWSVVLQNAAVFPVAMLTGLGLLPPQVRATAVVRRFSGDPAVHRLHRAHRPRSRAGHGRRTSFAGRAAQRLDRRHRQRPVLSIIL